MGLIIESVSIEKLDNSIENYYVAIIETVSKMKFSMQLNLLADSIKYIPWLIDGANFEIIETAKSKIFVGIYPLMSELRKLTKMEHLDKKQKHTYKNQFEVLVDIMKLHPDIAKGFSQRAPAKITAFWEDISEKLNAMGPPVKDKTGWKKVWTDFKFAVKRKMIKNTKQISATGGGPFNKINLSSLEEEVSAILSFNKSVEGLKGIKSFGTSTNISDDIPSTSKKRPIDDISSQPQIQNEISFLSSDQQMEILTT